MVIFRSIFSIFLSFNTQLTHLNASKLLNFDSLTRFLPIASQSWCSGVSKMATYIPIYIVSRGVSGSLYRTSQQIEISLLSYENRFLGSKLRPIINS